MVYLMSDSEKNYRIQTYTNVGGHWGWHNDGRWNTLPKIVSKARFAFRMVIWESCLCDDYRIVDRQGRIFKLPNEIEEDVIKREARAAGRAAKALEEARAA